MAENNNNKEETPKTQPAPEVDFEKLLDQEKKRTEDYLNRLKYMQADFENLRRRFDREAEQIRNHSNERLVMELLDVVDELELAVNVGKCAENPQKTLLEGVEMTLKKLKKILEQEGVSPVDCAVGKIFDPSTANAVLTEERDDVPDCTIVQVIRKGYSMRGRVIRPSIVKVSVKPKQKTENKNSNNNSEEKK
jgi:molecular chaperone GrpE